MRVSAPLAPMPPGHWLTGHLPERAREPLRLYLGSRELLGDVVRYRMGYVYVEQLTHPDHVKHVLVDASSTYAKGTVWDKLRPLIGDGVVTAEGESWRWQRRLVQPVFHRAQLAGLGTVMTDTIDHTLRGWEDSAERHDLVPVFTQMRRLTLKVVVRSLFGVDMDVYAPAISEAFTRALEVTDARIISPAPYLPWLYRLPTASNRAFRQAVGTLHSVVGRIIAERRVGLRSTGEGLTGERENRGTASGGRSDLLGMLMTDSASDTDPMSPGQLRDEVMTLLMAGYETTATTLSWAFHLLAQHPEAEAAVRAQAEEVLGGRNPTADDLPRLTYLRRVLEETMRLYPAVWALPRVPVRDDEIDGYRIPRGDIVILVPYVTHRHPDFWPDPERFDPDRFLPENRQGAPRWAYFPFGAGQRQCLGNNFAMMEAQFVLAMVAQRFRLSSAEASVTADPYVTLRPRGEMPMRVTRVGARRF